jgi:hypothetical protein
VLSEAVSEAEVESGPIYRRAKIDTSSVGNEQVYGRRIIGSNGSGNNKAVWTMHKKQ